MKREEFLGRVAARLARSHRSAQPRETRDARGPAWARARADASDRFAAELQRVGGALVVCDSPRTLEARLLDFLVESDARTAVAFARRSFDPLDFAAIDAQLRVVTPGRADDRGESFRRAAAHADVGLTVADLGVAASGSLLFLTEPSRPRCVSLLPRSHVAILRAADIVDDLQQAFVRLSARGATPSSALFVTGPSRTSDIENDLTLGVHGPAAVTVFLLRD